jgi:plastocyanin
MRTRAVPLAVLLALVLAAPAAADQQIAAGPVDTFTTPSPSMAQGERLTFLNNDLATHTVTADTNGADGKPLFDSGNVNQGASALVQGSQFLTTGSYAFHCAIHSFMKGTLTVTAEGTPVARPVDTTKPKVGVTFPKQTLAGILKAKKVNVRVTLDEPAAAEVTVTAKAGKKTVSLGTVKSAFKTATSRTVAVKLSSSAQKSLAKAKSVSFTAGGQAADTAGNVGRAKTAKLTASR